MTLSALERFRQITRVLQACAAICGANVTDPNYRINKLTIFVMTAIFAFFSSIGYSVFRAIVVDKDWTMIMQATAMLPSGIEGLAKLLTAIYCQHLIRFVQNALDNIYEEYEQKNEIYKRCLQQHIKKMQRLLICFVFCYVILVGILTIFPFVYRAIFKQKVMVMQFFIPLINHQTEAGYLMLLASHIIMLWLGGFGNFAGDMYLFVFITHIPLLKDLMNCKINDLNAVVLADRNPSKTLPILTDIFKWHQKYIDIIEKTEETFFGVVFVQIFATAYSIICCLTCLFVGVWPVAGAMMIYGFILLYAYCALGTVVEIANDEMSTAIYTNCLWYELSVREQKMVLLMLLKSQKSIDLTVGKVIKLSLSTALTVTRAIYSYAMMLYNFLN